MEVIYNDETLQVPADCTVADLLELLELDNRRVAVEVNLQLVPRTQHRSHRLAAGDSLEVVTLVGGG